MLAGDGRCDSPGKYAKYCTYSLIEQDNNLIVHMEILDKREVRLQSPNMEREALLRSLSYLSEHVNIEEVITDASTSVTKLLCKSYIQNITRQNFRESKLLHFFVKFSYACK